MKIPVIAALAAVAVITPLSQALAKEGEPRPSERAVALCTHDARSLKGAEHDQFMAACLKGRAATSQQNKMKICNVEAGRKDLHGDERRAFMSNCLKG